MNIDLNKIKDILVINEEYNFDESYFQNTNIKKLPKVAFNGKISFDYENDLKLEGTCEGIMILSDSITLDDIQYPFSFEIEYVLDKNNEEMKEYFVNDQNTLDIMEILWQNIVLEVPMRITNHDLDNLKTSGEGWELKSEEKKEIDPRLAKLTELLDDTGKE